jgi:hypothetical protein
MKPEEILSHVGEPIIYAKQALYSKRKAFVDAAAAWLCAMCAWLTWAIAEMMR